MGGYDWRWKKKEGTTIDRATADCLACNAGNISLIGVLDLPISLYGELVEQGLNRINGYNGGFKLQGSGGEQTQAEADYDRLAEQGKVKPREK